MMFQVAVYACGMDINLFYNLHIYLLGIYIYILIILYVLNFCLFLIPDFINLVQLFFTFKESLCVLCRWVSFEILWCFLRFTPCSYILVCKMVDDSIFFMDFLSHAYLYFKLLICILSLWFFLSGHFGNWKYCKWPYYILLAYFSFIILCQ